MYIGDLERLLMKRHSDDVLLFEVKDGPTHTHAHSRIDALAIKRTWSPVNVIGYEIKRSRSDFIRDEKWHNYLKMCTQLYFVAPYKMLNAHEIPEQCGLIEASRHAKILKVKKIAPYRAIKIDYHTLMYILICRAYSVDGSRDLDVRMRDKVNRAEAIKEYVANKRSARKTGVQIRQMVGERRSKIMHENERLQAEISALKKVKAFCEKNNIQVDYWAPHENDLRSVIEKQDAQEFYDLAGQMNRLLDRIRRS